MFARFVARRYLFSPKSRSVINLIAGLSAVAVAMPVAAMIVLLSVFNGFETLVKATGSAFEADLTVEPAEGQTFPVAELDTAAVARTAGVEAFAFVLEQGRCSNARGGRPRPRYAARTTAMPRCSPSPRRSPQANTGCGWATSTGWSWDGRWRRNWASARWRMPTWSCTGCAGAASRRCCRFKATRSAGPPQRGLHARSRHGAALRADLAPARAGALHAAGPRFGAARAHRRRGRPGTGRQSGGAGCRRPFSRYDAGRAQRFVLCRHEV